MLSFEPSPSDKANANVVIKFYEAIFSGDWEGVEKCVAKNLVVEEAMGLPYGGVYHGLDGLKQLLGIVASYWDEMNLEVNSVTAGNGYVVGLLAFSGRVKATGARISMPVAEVTQFENNLMARISPHYWDTKAMSDAIGVS